MEPTLFRAIPLATSTRALEALPSFINTTGERNTAIGDSALYSNTTGFQNTATGNPALVNNTTGNRNTATGAFALFGNTSGSENTASGVQALYSNTGNLNTATGARALQNNTTGGNNTANGYQALFRNTTGDYNTANGLSALASNTTGDGNTANGAFALFSNTTAGGNTATGYQALDGNTTGDESTANGYQALYSNTTGYGNTATGFQALSSNTIGAGNTALGDFALSGNATGFRNIALGVAAGSNVATASDVICIGAHGNDVNNSCYIGQIFGRTSSGGTQVFINSDGRLGTTTSSRRFKEDIKSMDRASEALFALKPVTFRYKKGIDPQGIPQFGLVAEDVQKVNPDLVVRDAEGKLNTVRYDQVNAMLLNEFLKAHHKMEEQERKIQNQQATITELRSSVARNQKEFQSGIAQQRTAFEALSAHLREQDSKIQRVSDQLEMSKPEPQLAVGKP